MYTDRDTNIHERVEKGKTTLIEDRREAKKFAVENRSYHYPVFNGKGHRIGFGIPK